MAQSSQSVEPPQNPGRFNYARLYGLTRDELRYILDPKEVMGEDYPSETFRVLKEGEIRTCGKYRTRLNVLEAWDRLNLSQ